MKHSSCESIEPSDATIAPGLATKLHSLRDIGAQHVERTVKPNSHCGKSHREVFAKIVSLRYIIFSVIILITVVVYLAEILFCLLLNFIACRGKRGNHASV